MHQATRAAGLSDAEGAKSFLKRLVVKDNVVASTQAQALNALACLFKEVLGRQFGGRAPHLLESGVDIRTVQEPLGQSGVSMTMIYTPVLNRPGLAVRSPADD